MPTEETKNVRTNLFGHVQFGFCQVVNFLIGTSKLGFFNFENFKLYDFNFQIIISVNVQFQTSKFQNFEFSKFQNLKTLN